jgi:hypothetical protein
VRGFRPEPSGAVPSDTKLPVLIEPEGELPNPPKVFRWTPGGTDVDLAQIAIYHTSLEPVWQSAPIHGSSLEIDPAVVFQGIGAGEKLCWRVREVTRGRPRATSAFARFQFDLDARGLGKESPPEERPLGTK